MTKSQLTKMVTVGAFYGLFSSSMILSTGCSSFLAAAHKGPIHQDPGQRSRGETIDDKQITTFLKVNLTKADPAFEKANINFLKAGSALVRLTLLKPTRPLKKQISIF